MPVTEAEAQTRMCPVAHSGNEPSVRDVSDDSTRCVGSNCMVWRWSKSKKGDVPMGYCGLAAEDNNGGDDD